MRKPLISFSLTMPKGRGCRLHSPNQVQLLKNVKLRNRAWRVMLPLIRIGDQHSPIRILNYIGDWLLLAQSQELELQHRDIVLAYLQSLGLRLNAKNSVLSPAKRTMYLGVVWDSVTVWARLSPAHVEFILNTLSNVRL